MLLKFQSFKADNLVRESLKLVNYQKKNLKKNITQIKMLKSLELSEVKHKIIIKYCKRKKISFLSSPFYNESLDLLFKLKSFNIKIASGEITHYALLKSAAKKAKKIFLSSGMSNLNEIKTALKILKKYGPKNKEIYVLHCHSDYPTKINDVNLGSFFNIFKDTNIFEPESDVAVLIRWTNLIIVIWKDR